MSANQDKAPNGLPKPPMPPMPPVPQAPATPPTSGPRPTRSRATQPATKPAVPQHKPAVEMPYWLSLGMLVGCVALAFVDLSFLYEVIGEVLDFEFWPAVGVSCGVGLVGLLFMAHLGFKEANHSVHPVSRTNVLVHYAIWLLLGVAVAAARFYRATILGLDGSDGESLVNVLGSDVTQTDIVFAPIMFLMYLITGLGAKEAVESLLLNGGWHRDQGKKKTERDKLKLEREKARKAQLAKVAEAQKEQEERRKQVLAAKDETRLSKVENAQKMADLKLETAKKLEEQKVAAAAIAEEQRVKKAEADAVKAEADAVKANELRDVNQRKQAYYDAVQRYKQLEGKFHDAYREVSDRLAEVEQNEASASVLNQAGDNLVGVINKSEASVQQQVAMLIHGKAKVSVAELRAVIAAHNAQTGN